MAVDVAQIGTVYDVLIGKAKETLLEEYNSNRLKNEGYTTVLSHAIEKALDLSVSSVQQQPLTD